MAKGAASLGSLAQETSFGQGFCTHEAHPPRSFAAPKDPGSSGSSTRYEKNRSVDAVAMTHSHIRRPHKAQLV